jgi:Skp family chaperone for outer membrane proteins
MRSKIILAAAIGLTAAFTAAAQKVAWIDMQAALLTTNDGQAAQTELKKKFEPREQQFQKRQTELQAKQQQYQKTSNTMSEAAKAAAEREMDALSRGLDRDNQDAQQDFQDEENRVLTPLLQKMQGVINKYAADNQISIVVDASRQQNNLIYADPASDITKAIVLLYNQAPAASAPAPAATKPAAATPPAAAPARPATPAPKPF